jgi:hypothetical protein
VGPDALELDAIELDTGGPDALEASARGLVPKFACPGTSFLTFYL